MTERPNISTIQHYKGDPSQCNLEKPLQIKKKISPEDDLVHLLKKFKTFN